MSNVVTKIQISHISGIGMAFCQINDEACRKHTWGRPLWITVGMWSQCGATCTRAAVYIFLTAKASGIMINHGSHVRRHTTLFTQVMHVNKQCCAIHLPLEFKKEGEKRMKAPRVLVSHLVPDKQRIGAVEGFSGESVTENQRLWDPTWNEKKKEAFHYHAKHEAYAIQLQNKIPSSIKWG